MRRITIIVPKAGTTSSSTFADRKEISDVINFLLLLRTISGGDNIGEENVRRLVDMAEKRERVRANKRNILYPNKITSLFGGSR
jgi:hypothetical protein